MRGSVSPDLLDRLREAGRGLPELEEREAWVGTAWRVHDRTVAQVLTVEPEWPPAYARAVAVRVPTPILTFRSAGAELELLRSSGRPFHAAAWHPEQVCMELTAETDWTEVTELIVESYRVVAPRSLSARLPV